MASILSPLPAPRTDSPEPTYAELRARNLLAQALINQRRTSDGLSVADTACVRLALLGKWDAV